MSEELKPCPFCGADPDISVQEDDTEDTYYVVACTNCNMAHSSSDDENVAIRNWNDRPIEDAQAARIAELEAERDRLREVVEKLVWLYSDEHQERLDNELRIDGFYSHEWLGMILDMAREAMKGAEE
ncbi:Lar family restriction alleviation protein [Victivallis vadensis]|jgi:Lar family restriction alleviation protein|uniref:Lar family restriction alleviation protein n=1 Tax=Victivallis vadensis TaxID=172901 RepID=UPI0023F735E7|nr:Lar family restriction alleviation protein [Victivallis vadensis]